MIELNAKQLEKWKVTFAKSGIVYDNDDDYREAASNLVGYFDLLIQMDQQQKRASKVDTASGVDNGLTPSA